MRTSTPPPAPPPTTKSSPINNERARINCCVTRDATAAPECFYTFFFSTRSTYASTTTYRVAANDVIFSSHAHLRHGSGIRGRPFEILFLRARESSPSRRSFARLLRGRIGRHNNILKTIIFITYFAFINNYQLFIVSGGLIANAEQTVSVST